MKSVFFALGLVLVAQTKSLKSLLQTDGETVETGTGAAPTVCNCNLTGANPATGLPSLGQATL